MSTTSKTSRPTIADGCARSLGESGRFITVCSCVNVSFRNVTIVSTRWKLAWSVKIPVRFRFMRFPRNAVVRSERFVAAAMRSAPVAFGSPRIVAFSFSDTLNDS